MTPGARRCAEAVEAFSGGSSHTPVAYARGLDSIEIAREIRSVVSPAGLAALLVFFSSSYDAEILASELERLYPKIPVFGCTTAGELSPEGICAGGAVAIGLPASDFAVAGRVIEEIDSFAMESAGALARDLRQALEHAAGYHAAGDTFGLLLIDGLCRREELVVAALNNALDDIPLAGGSAGDDLAFQRTFVLGGGRARSGAAALLLINTLRPIRLFKVDHFEPTNIKMVVTGAVSEERRVTELNAEPAAQQYARAIGVDDSELTPFAFAAHPIVVRIGGEYFARAIGRVSADGSLNFFCAIDEGLVLRAARPRDTVQCMSEALEQISDELDEPEFVLGFDCVLRRLDAEQGQATRELSKIYRRHHVVGFNTYGEQYRSMHLNQTFTGVAIGRTRRNLPKS